MTRIGERDIDRLVRIIDHCDKIRACMDRFGDDINVFKDDPFYQDAVYMNIFQIGEISHYISEDCLKQMPEVPWAKIYGQRNVIAHGYETLLEETVWNTIKTDIPELSKSITSFLGSIGVDL